MFMKTINNNIKICREMYYIYKKTPTKKYENHLISRDFVYLSRKMLKQEGSFQSYKFNEKKIGYFFIFKMQKIFYRRDILSIFTCQTIRKCYDVLKFSPLQLIFLKIVKQKYLK